MVEGNIGFRTCQFVQNYIVYTFSILVLIILAYAMTVLYILKPHLGGGAVSGVSDEVNLGEDYAFIVDNELDGIRYNRFRHALPPPDQKLSDSQHPLTDGHNPQDRKDNNTSRNLRFGCSCSKVRNGNLKYFHLITTNPVCMTIYLSAIIGTLAIGFYVSNRLGLKRWLNV